MINQIWPETLNPAAAETWSHSSLSGRRATFLKLLEATSWLSSIFIFAHSRLRMPVLEVLGSDAFRVSIAERVRRSSETPPLEVMPDLIAGALAQRNIDRAIQLLESEKDGGALGAR